MLWTIPITPELKHLKVAVSEIVEGLVSPSAVRPNDAMVYCNAALLTQSAKVGADYLEASALYGVHSSDTSYANQLLDRQHSLLISGNGWKPVDVGNLTEPKHQAPRFPVGVFPNDIERFVDCKARSIQVDRASVAVGVLGAAAAATMGKYRVQGAGSKHHCEELPLYFAIVQAPSQRKSSVLKECISPFYEVIAENKNDYKQKVLKYNLDCRSLESTLKRLTKQRETLDDKADVAELDVEINRCINDLSKIRKPVNKNFIFQDGTPEGLARMMLEETGEMAFLAADEMQTLTKLRSSSKGEPNYGLFNASKSAESVSIRRGSKEATQGFLRAPLMTILQYAQPQKWNEFETDPDISGHGLRARFIVCYPPSVKHESVNTAAYDKEAVESYRATIAEYFSIAKPDDEPPKITYSADAERLVSEYTQSLHDEAFLVETYDPNRAQWLEKFCGDIDRIVAVLHLLEHPCAASDYSSQVRNTPALTKISAETAQNALKVANFFYESYDEGAKAARTVSDNMEKIMLECVVTATLCKGVPCCTIRDIRRMCYRGLKKQAFEANALYSLADMGAIEIVKPVSNFGTQKKIIWINPYIASMIFDEI